MKISAIQWGGVPVKDLKVTAHRPCECGCDTRIGVRAGYLKILLDDSGCSGITVIINDDAAFEAIAKAVNLG